MVDEERINKLKNILENNPDSPLFTQYADLLRKANRIDEAIAILENGTRKHPNNSTAYLILGRCFNDKGAMEAAIKNFEHASELEPQNILAHKELGNAYISIGEKEKALALFKKVLTLDDNDIEVKKIIEELSAEESKKSVDEDIGDMSEKGDFFSFFDNASIPPQKSSEVTEKAEKKEPSEEMSMPEPEKQEKAEGPDWLNIELARIYIKHNFKEKAIDVLKKLQEIDPENQEVIDLLKSLGAIPETPREEEKVEKKIEEKPEGTASQEFTEMFGEKKITEEEKLTGEEKPPAGAVSLDELFGDKEEPPSPPPEPPKPEDKSQKEETKDMGQFKSWLDNLNKGE